MRKEIIQGVFIGIGWVVAIIVILGYGFIN